LSNGAFVRNQTACPHAWGNNAIPAGTIRFMPAEVVEALRQSPVKGVIILEDNPDIWLFGHTDHLPTNPRYQK
jgi:hypothetical protein